MGVRIRVTLVKYIKKNYKKEVTYEKVKESKERKQKLRA